MAQNAERFSMTGCSEPIYGATSSRVTGNDRLGEIPYFPDSITGRPLIPEPDLDEFIAVIIAQDWATSIGDSLDGDCQL